MTNADCIRRMSDEQLYEFLSEWECGDIDYSITFCDLCKQGGNELNLDCDGCRKHWLQRDAVDYGGLMYWKKNTTFDIKADRKTENSSEKPNNCEAKNYCDDCLYTDTCDSKEFFYACTSKATISKMEQVETEPQTQKCDRPQMDCKNCWKKLHCRVEDEPQTERSNE